jgi:hypothetical protein
MILPKDSQYLIIYTKKVIGQYNRITLALFRNRKEELIVGYGIGRVVTIVANILNFYANF